MAITDATIQYSSRIDEMIRRGLLSTIGVNNNVEYGKGRVVKIYSNPYDESNHSFSMSHQKSFTFATDRADTNKSLQRQIEQIIVPAIDTHRFSVFTDRAGMEAHGIFTIKNAYNIFKKSNSILTNKGISKKEGRIAFCTNSFIELLIESRNLTRLIDLPDNTIVYKGMVGSCDNIPIIAVPKRRFPEDVAFIIIHPQFVYAPIKLQEYKIYREVAGIDGTLVEGLIYYDTFVSNKNRNSIIVGYDLSTGALIKENGE